MNKVPQTKMFCLFYVRKYYIFYCRSKTLRARVLEIAFEIPNVSFGAYLARMSFEANGISKPSVAAQLGI